MAGIIKAVGDGVGAIGDDVGNAVKGVANAGILPSLSLSLPLPTGILPTGIIPTGTNTTTNTTGTDIPSPSGLNTSLPLSDPSATPSNTTLIVPSVTPTPNNTLPAADLSPSNTTTTLVNTVIAGNGASASSAAPAPKSFLQNKPLAGAVFGLAGLAAVVLIFVIATWAMRRRRRGRLMDEAISFEPTTQHTYAEDMERLNEKASLSDTGYSAPYGAAAVPQSQGYYNHSGAGGAYNQHPGGAYPQFTLPSQSGY